MKIKRVISEGEIGNVESTEEMLEVAGDLLDACESHEILGHVVFEGEDGKFYRCNVEAVIVEENPEYVRQLLADMGDG